MFGLSAYGEFCYRIEKLGHTTTCSGVELYFCEGLEKYAEHMFVDTIIKLYIIED